MKSIKPRPPISLNAKSISSLSFWKIWPNLPSEILAWLELEQDEYYSLIPHDQVITYIQSAIQYGNELAVKFPTYQGLKELCNLLIKDGIRVNFPSRHSSSEWIRAQYHSRSSTIEVYQTSLQQLQDFFLYRCKEAVKKEDLIALHLYHEWFHYLEEQKYGRTDQLLPKVRVKKWGSFSIKHTIYQTREIAAHAFTQTMLRLEWSPLLLDQLLLFLHQGWTRVQIREHFSQLRLRFDQLLQEQSQEEDSKETKT
ncbi:hypothetical protein [Thermoflavimicrobium daqui]|uniref:Uncharacterized protein n=1 Tax=Thermoflavimicrobium daqui TaxID=2137476 RepID=A0A364K8Y0_9BACL|nr:hypothetical protein [Thermoflavimicrobium daqui]RAL26753.1 hypothetical protein DL897_01490 [Thermoflavimicrobium daqui]